MYRTSRPWIVVWGIGLHLIFAFSLLVRPEVTSQLLLLVGLNEFLSTGISPRAFGVILGACALVAAAGLVAEPHLTPRQIFACMAGQYFFMVAAFVSDAWILVAGYRSPATGMTADRVVVFTVLGPIMLAALLHTVVIYQRYASFRR